VGSFDEIWNQEHCCGFIARRYSLKDPATDCSVRLALHKKPWKEVLGA